MAPIKLFQSKVRKLHSKRKRFFLLGVLGVVGVLSLLFVAVSLPEQIVNPETSKVFLFSDGSLMRAFLTADEKWRFPTKIEEYPDFLIGGLTCLEDQRFFFHPGVDPFAISRAAIQNFRHQRRVSGASTLTMQVSRMVGNRKRTLPNKIFEMFYALFLEAKMSKKEILRQYLVRAPFGSNIEGIEAASFRYFDKPARFLTKGEAAFLYLLPQAPHRWDRKNEEELIKLRETNLNRWLKCGVINREELRTANREKIPSARHYFKTYAGHLTDWQKSRLRDGQPVIMTVSKTVQHQIENILATKRQEFQKIGISNAGVMVTKIKSRELIGAAGNFEYSDNQKEQRINSLVTFRSPGSLLKPFLFAKLIQMGRLTPESLIEDVPIEIDDYNPKNYDGDFNGLVRADRALADSLNVPWVRELKKVGIAQFLSFLEAGLIKTNIPPDKVGLSLVIGGMEVRMWDLVTAYTALAGDGKVGEIKIQAGDKDLDPSLWIDSGVTFLTQESLGLKGRPDFGLDPKQLSQTEIKWKTGTSQGRRDAWAIGFDDTYVVAVWLGNLDRTSSPALVGGTAAAPLMFDIFNRINRQKSRVIASTENEPRSHLVEHEVCAFSGFAPVDACKERRTVKGVKGVSLKTRCPYHQEVLVDLNTGYRVEQKCVGQSIRPIIKSFTVLPKDVAYWYENSLQVKDSIPTFHPDCKTRPGERGHISILSPKPQVYILHSALGNGSMSLPVRVKRVATSENQRCFLNGTELNINLAESQESQITVTPGQYELFCIDRAGRSGAVDFAVQN